MARLSHGRGDFKSGEEMYKQSLTKRQKALGENHLDTHEIIRELGEFYFSINNYDKAEFLMKRARAGYEKVLGPSYLAECDNFLGIICSAKGDFASAEPLLERALAGLEKHLGADHPSTGRSRHALAV